MNKRAEGRYKEVFQVMLAIVFLNCHLKILIKEKSRFTDNINLRCTYTKENERYISLSRLLWFLHLLTQDPLSCTMIFAAQDIAVATTHDDSLISPREDQ